MTYNTIHFVGIKGVGMTALAVLVKEAGASVTGSDVAEQFITDSTLQEAGISPFVGFSPEHVNDATLVITTGAHGGYDNPEVVSAKEKGIRVLSLAEAIGLCIDGTLLGRKLKGISVAGTHGKTTTTAMIATLLRANDLDPSFYIGTSSVPTLGKSGHYGTGDYFVIEADEYATEPVHDKRAKFLWQHPQIAIITNIELDHPDIYPSVEVLQATFLQFVQQIEDGGVVIAFGDDHVIQALRKDFSGRMITYGFSEQNDFILNQVKTVDGITSFTVNAYGTDLGTFSLAVAGEHNCLNAVAAIVTSLEIGLKPDKIKTALSTFSGSKRRLEKKGVLSSGALLFDDYGHHPTEIRKTLSALRSMFPEKHIVCVFQPHTYSRTKALFNDFIHAFSDADTALLTDIYASKREESDSTVSSGMLVEEMKKYKKDVFFLPSAQDVVEYLNEKQYSEDTVIVTMGAGDIYKISDSLVA